MLFVKLNGFFTWCLWKNWAQSHYLYEIIIMGEKFSRNNKWQIMTLSVFSTTNVYFIYKHNNNNNINFYWIFLESVKWGWWVFLFYSRNKPVVVIIFNKFLLLLCISLYTKLVRCTCATHFTKYSVISFIFFSFQYSMDGMEWGCLSLNIIILPQMLSLALNFIQNSCLSFCFDSYPFFPWFA